MSKKLLAILGLSCIITVLLVACGSSGASAGPNPVQKSSHKLFTFYGHEN